MKKQKTNYCKRFSPKLYAIIRRIGQIAKQHRYPAYIVGGVVRDILLKKRSLDLDIVIEGDAIKVAKTIAKKYKGQITVHDQFKTATVAFAEDKIMRIDFASARQESYPRPGVLPVVKLGNLENDLFRRDFTINALAISLNQNNFGQLIDHFGGLNDLRNKRIRILHEKSFIDDPTRILRAIRFEQRLKFRLESKTKTLLVKALKEKRDLAVSPPRYFSELKKIFLEPDRVRCLRKLDHLGVLRLLGQKLTINIKELSYVNRRAQRLVSQAISREELNVWIFFMALLCSKVKSATLISILNKIQIKNTEKKIIMQCQKERSILKALCKKHLSPSDIYKILNALERQTVVYLHLKSNNTIATKNINAYLRKYSQIVLKINGDDLMELGIETGQRLGKILDLVLYEKMNRSFRTKIQELKYARSLME